MHRPHVVLPQPDSPTNPKRSPECRGERYAIHYLELSLEDLEHHM